MPVFAVMSPRFARGRFGDLRHEEGIKRVIHQLPEE
jgi:hypothetical protein